MPIQTEEHTEITIFALNKSVGPDIMQIGDIPGAGAVATGQPVSHCDDCAKLCSDHADCLSYECSMTDLNCNLNNVANPTAGAWKDYAFCTKNGPTTRYRLLNM